MFDINCDMGEIKDFVDNNTYAELMKYVTSINLACGGHAGDDDIMEEMIQIAKQKHVKIGAHPSYPDRENFGRLELNISPEQLFESITSQIQKLIDIAKKEDVRIEHVKPHGALYNIASNNNNLAELIGKSVQKIDPKLAIMCLAGSPMVSILQKSGMNVITEAFADRAYNADGSLRNRNLDGALITDPVHATNQAKLIANNQKVIAFDGSEVSIQAKTICVHSDTPNALEISKAVSLAINSYD
jgi:UPF0271 protein